MPAFIVWIAGAMGWVLKHLAARIVVMLGIQAVTVTGLSAFLLDLKEAAVTAYGQMPLTMIQVLGLLRIDQAALVIFAAFTARLTMGFAQDSVTRIVGGRPGEGQL